MMAVYIVAHSSSISEFPQRILHSRILQGCIHPCSRCLPTPVRVEGRCDLEAAVSANRRPASLHVLSLLAHTTPARTEIVYYADCIPASASFLCYTPSCQHLGDIPTQAFYHPVRVTSPRTPSRRTSWKTRHTARPSPTDACIDF